MTIFIDKLMEKGFITIDQLSETREKQIGAKKPLQELLVDMGFISDEDLIKTASEVFEMPIVSLDGEVFDKKVIKAFPYEKAKRYGVLPLRKEDGKTILAMSDPQDIDAIDVSSSLTGSQIVPVLATKEDINKFTEKVYDSDESLYDLLKNAVVGSKMEAVSGRDEGRGDKGGNGGDGADASPMVRLVEFIFVDAVNNRASDIHIEPQSEYSSVRYRIDGELRNIVKIPAGLHGFLVRRIKIISNLDITEERKAFDGKSVIMINKEKVDIRISIIPSYYGEKVVLRILGRMHAGVNLDGIGFEGKDLEKFREEIKRPQGMILVTGPTGSGKTSTLHAAISEVKNEARNIITIEDPVEYLVEGVTQIQVNAKKDITFVNGLKSILRQDPDVIFVGEIRDLDTAQIAFRAALTGHMVFSTLHTNSAVACITRLRDLGLELYLLASSVNLVLAQRLVKTICPHCREKYTPQEDLLKQYKIYLDVYKAKEFYHGSGCSKCGFRGFYGRTAICEMVIFTDGIRSLVSKGASETEIVKKARDEGMRTLVEAGIEKVIRGITTLEEVAQLLDLPIKEECLKEDVRQEVKREKPLILIADDENDLRLILAQRLIDAGYDVLQAIDGREAVRLATMEAPDIIVTDLMMPIMDGISAVKELRANLETAGIPIIMLTAKQDKESEIEGFDAGADDYITKPYDKDRLFKRIEILIKRRKRDK
ncbi:MAG: ATPase, T2SS/T4P/T4SS family [Elusimicrobia bacterium]|nr:ATPase, T2SS/T4P/T4SS family [Elusimicrobiota bacterium]